MREIIGIIFKKLLILEKLKTINQNINIKKYFDSLIRYSNKLAGVSNNQILISKLITREYVQIRELTFKN